jgi:hypothetical protein
MSQRRVPANPGGLFPFVCCDCRRVFRRPFDNFRPRPCPVCGRLASCVFRKFRPPPAAKAAQWEKVRLLISHGFLFQTIPDGHGGNVRYPATLKEATVWVTRWASAAAMPVER